MGELVRNEFLKMQLREITKLSGIVEENLLNAQIILDGTKIMVEDQLKRVQILQDRCSMITQSLRRIEDLLNYVDNEAKGKG